VSIGFDPYDVVEIDKAASCLHRVPSVVARAKWLHGRFPSEKMLHSSSLRMATTSSESDHSGDREQFWRAARERYTPLMLSYIRRVPCSADEARDVVADVWGVAAESEQEFIATPDPWSALVRWLRVVCADRVRVWRREVSVDPTLLVTRAGGGSDLEPAERPEAEFGEWLTRISSRLPQKERLAFELRYLQRYSYVEVAATLRCSQPAARKAVSRGLRKVRDMAEKSPPEGWEDVYEACVE